MTGDSERVGGLTKRLTVEFWVGLGTLMTRAEFFFLIIDYLPLKRDENSKICHSFSCLG